MLSYPATHAELLPFDTEDAAQPGMAPARTNLDGDGPIQPRVPRSKDFAHLPAPSEATIS
jgi:hypothetical protein